MALTCGADMYKVFDNYNGPQAVLYSVNNMCTNEKWLDIVVDGTLLLLSFVNSPIKYTLHKDYITLAPSTNTTAFFEADVRANCILDQNEPDEIAIYN